MTAEPSGADLVRRVLDQARAAARANPQGTKTKQPRRRLTATRGSGRDPVGLGDAVAGFAFQQGWDAPVQGGDLIARWQEICPADLVDQVTPCRYDSERKVLHVRPRTRAAATLLTYTEAQFVTHLNRGMGADVVARLRLLSPGSLAPAVAPTSTPETASVPEPAGPTGAPPTEEILAWRQHHAAQRAAREATPDYGTHPMFRDAYGRLREDPAAFTDAIAAMEAAGELPVDDAERRKQDNERRHQAALARARTTPRNGDPQPIRDTTAA